LYLEDESYLQEIKRAEVMKNFNASDEDIKKLRKSLSNYSKHRYYDYSKINPKGPILVIFGETHNNAEIIFKNYLELKKTIDYYNFIGIERTASNIYNDPQEYKDLNINKGTLTNKILKSILDEIILEQGGGIVSGDLIELYFIDDIVSIGVEPENLDKFSEKIMRNDDDVFNNITLNYRNNIWLKTIQKNIMILGKENGKNFIPITCGSLHNEGLAKLAKYRGFKGVISLISYPKDKKISTVNH
jgi:hypothetical protein